MINTENLPPIPEQFCLAIDAKTLDVLAFRAESVRGSANSRDVLDPFTVQNCIAELADVVLTLLRADRCLVWPPNEAGRGS